MKRKTINLKYLILNLEKIESGKDPLIMQEYDLNILIDRVMERFKVQFDELKIKFIKIYQRKSLI